MLARHNAHHPGEDYFRGLAWDGNPRLDRVAVEILRTGDHLRAEDATTALGAISYAIKALMVTSVRRVRQRRRTGGVKSDELLVLVGSQGARKSTFVRELYPDPQAYTDNLFLDSDPKTVLEQTAGKLIVETAEMQTRAAKGRVAAIKDMLSTCVDRARPSYGRFAIERNRQFVMIGTTNKIDFFNDPTGGRRFRPIRVGTIDIKKLIEWREQLWAEAVVLEREGFKLHAPLDVDTYWRSVQAAGYDAHPWVDHLRDVLAGTAIVWSDKGVPALFNLLGVPAKDQNPSKQQDLGRALRELGFERSTQRRGGRVSRCWVRSGHGETEFDGSSTPVDDDFDY